MIKNFFISFELAFMKTFQFNLFPLTASIACLLWQPLHAQTQNTPNDAGSLSEVKVINTSPLPGIGIEKYKLPYEVQSVDSQTIQKSGGRTLSEFMNENLTGVNVNDIQGSPYQSDVTYRGMRASSTLGASQGLSVYMDGVRMNQPFGDVVNWDMFPEAAIDTVTLVPGSNPMYGLNTLGGALAFTTKSGLTTQGNELTTSYGSHRRLKLDITHGGKSSDGWHRFLAISAFDEDGWRDHSSGSLQNLFVKIGRTQEDTNWDVTYMFGNSKLHGNGLTPSTNYGEFGAASASNTTTGLYEADRVSVYTWPDQTINKAHVLSFNMQHVLDANTELASTAYVKYGTQSRLGGDVEWDNNSAEGIINRNSSKQTTVGVATNLTKILDQHQITTGATLERSKMSYGATSADGCDLSSSTREVSTTGCGSALDTAGVTGTSTAFGTYLADTYKLSDKTFVTVATRFNQTTVANTLTSYDNTGVSEGSESESFTYRKFNPSLGMTHQFGQLTVFGNWAQSNRAPTVMELGCADKDNPCALPTGLQADPYLSQVVSQTLEAGMRWKNESGYNLSLSAYRTINKDDIIFIAASTTTGYFDNFAKTQYLGVDINAGKSWGAWQLNSTYSYLKATYESSAELLGAEREMDITPGTRMAGIPLHKLKMHLDWSATEKWKLGTSMIASSSLVAQGNEDGLLDDGGGAGNAKVKGYALFNLKTTYAVQKGFEVFGKIDNVFNRRYETYAMLAPNSLTTFDDAGTAEQTLSKFVAPGATRTYMAGLRLKF
jgi:outer membrane receptor protein involved in Fe transport